MDIEFKWLLQKCVPGTFSTKRRSRQTPQTPACTRLLWTASVDFAKFIALHAGTLNRSVWDPRFSKVRAAGCKRHRYLVHIKPSRGMFRKLGCVTRTPSVVFTCSQFNNTIGGLTSVASTWRMMHCFHPRLGGCHIVE